MTDLLMLENWPLVPVGIVIATFASLIGIGGGLLWAPYLILVVKLDPTLAVFISFAIQLVGMGSATFRNLVNRTIYWSLAIRLVPLIVIGAVIGSYLNQRVADPVILEQGLGILSIVVALFFAFQTEKYDESMTLDKTISPPAWFQAQGGLFGVISGLFSVGIGDFLIPVMRSRLKIPMRYTIGTSLFCNFSLALMGTLAHFLLTEHPMTREILGILVYSWIGVIIGGQIGPKLSTMIEDTRLKEIFIFALLLIGIHLIYQSL